MPVFLKLLKNNTYILVLGLSALTLSACSNNFGPFSIPSGYSYHNEEYKAPPGPELINADSNMEVNTDTGEDINATEDVVLEVEDIIFEEETTAFEDNTSVTVYEDFPYKSQDGVVSSSTTNVSLLSPARDLIEKMIKSFGRPADSVYLVAVDPYEKMNSDFEKALRQAMTDKGLSIAPAPGFGPFTLLYGFTDMGYGHENESVMTLTLMSGQSELSVVSGVYEISNTVNTVNTQRVSTHEPAMRGYEPGTVSEPVSLFSP